MKRSGVLTVIVAERVADELFGGGEDNTESVVTVFRDPISFSTVFHDRVGLHSYRFQIEQYRNMEIIIASLYERSIPDSFIITNVRLKISHVRLNPPERKSFNPFNGSLRWFRILSTPLLTLYSSHLLQSVLFATMDSLIGYINALRRWKRIGITGHSAKPLQSGPPRSSVVLFSKLAHNGNLWQTLIPVGLLFGEVHKK